MNLQSPNLILDTPILLLYLIGSYETNFIRRFKRTHKYSREDYEYIKQIIMRARRIYITPQIVAEISNYSLEVDHGRLGNYMMVLIEKFKGFQEEYIKLEKLLKNDRLLTKIGFTDISIIESAKNIENCIVLTDDHPFSQKANSLGCRVINFTELRGYNWFNDQSN